MKLKVRILSIILIAVCVAGMFVYARSDRSIFEDRSFFSRSKTTVRIWYTDENLTGYLQSKAVSYTQSSQYVRVEPVLVSGLEYLEAINKASISEDSYPDLFIITNDSLEKAYLAGLAVEIADGEDYFSDEMFPAAAVNSVMYKDKYIAYPLYFETSSLIYNKTYLEGMVRERLMAESDDALAVDGETSAQENASESENDTSDVESTISDEIVAAAVEESLPKTVADILKFAQSYNAPDQVEAVFKWDVTDIFYNYFFVGNYMNVGGKAGDDVSLIDIYNTDTITCMDIYQQLNQFFAIDADEIDYDTVVDDFINGKIVFTVATTDILSSIKSAQDAGECEYEFGVADMPALTSEYDTRTMSVTDCIVVSGYSEHQSQAGAFARYLCNDNSSDFYTSTGKIAAHYGVKTNNSDIDNFLGVYANSVPMPKTIETSNLWMELEIAFTKIWNGEDANNTLKQVSESIMTQVTGEVYQEEYIGNSAYIDLMEGLTEDSD